MLETILPVANLRWSTDRFDVQHAGDSETSPCDVADGRFVTTQRADDVVTLTRDRLGLNKLYFAIHAERGVVAANNMFDLVRAGVSFDAVYAVPADATAAIDLSAHTIRLQRHNTLPSTASVSADPHPHLARARERLHHLVAVAAAAVPTASVAICLSGGLDSGLVAALVRQHFANVRAYTYTFDDQTGQLSPDAVAAERLARRLDIPFRLVTADADKILAALPRAYRFGQDWRDFNVHCAVVNELLAEAIATDTGAADKPVLVFTGDLMNELLADYSPVEYRGQEFYPLPPVPAEQARLSLVRGVQCGDREVGIFAARGLVIVQPYAQIFDELLRVPVGVAKPTVIRALAGSLLPDDSYDRPKVRAQIGSPIAASGILPLMVDAGRIGTRLEREFCQAIGVPQDCSLSGRVRAGIYRFPSHFPSEAK